MSRLVVSRCLPIYYLSMADIRRALDRELKKGAAELPLLSLLDASPGTAISLSKLIHQLRRPADVPHRLPLSHYEHGGPETHRRKRSAAASREQPTFHDVSLNVTSEKRCLAPFLRPCAQVCTLKDAPESRPRRSHSQQAAPQRDPPLFDERIRRAEHPRRAVLPDPCVYHPTRLGREATAARRAL